MCCLFIISLFYLAYYVQWSYEVSTNASKDILQKKWNKPAFLELTSDIQLFRNHLIHVQNVSIQELKNNPNNKKSFKHLE